MGRFQFSIRLMLAATAVVASAVWATDAKPSVSTLAIFALSMVFTSVSILAYTLTTGTLRTFWLGVMVPTGTQAIATVLLLALVLRAHDGFESLSQDMSTALSLRNTAIIAWCFAPINGLVCAIVHRLFRSPATRTSTEKNQLSK